MNDYSSILWEVSLVWLALFLSASVSGQENIALKASSSTSYVSPWESLSAINDGFKPADSNDRSHAVYGNWPETGTQWVQYEWSEPATTGEVAVYWFDDPEGIDSPTSSRLQYWNGSAWVTIATVGVSPNQYNVATFAAVTTSQLRLEFTANGSQSTGILEFRVMGTGGGAGPEEPPQDNECPAPVLSGDGPTLENSINSQNSVSSLILLKTDAFCTFLDAESQVMISMRTKSEQPFDFMPYQRFAERSGNGYAHLGDVTLRYRSIDDKGWINVSSYGQRSPVNPISDLEPGQLAAADITPTFPKNLPLAIVREWSLVNGELMMGLSLTNTSEKPVEIGALGVPMIFDNILSGRSLEKAHQLNSFSDPYIGGQSGYIQVTRLNGEGPVLLVLPEKNTSFEAYGPLLNRAETDPHMFSENTPRSITFEGFYQWMVHSKAYQSDVWSNAEQWNPPTSLSLVPGASAQLGFRFVLSDSIRNIEPTLIAQKHPVAVGFPGYVVSTDSDASLFLHAPTPVADIRVKPEGALKFVPAGTTKNGWQAYGIEGSRPGRAHVTISYKDGMHQSLHYMVTRPAEEIMSQMGEFLTSKAWYENPQDPFGRSPSVMTYDRGTDSILLQCTRAWVCGLGDDGGATWLAGVMKLLGKPNIEQVSKYERFVDEVIWGGLQYNSGPLRYGVKRTLFYYEPMEFPSGFYDPSLNWGVWSAWSKKHTLDVPRSYNYPHVISLYWVLYRLARNTEDLVCHHDWQWYLNQAYQTVVAMTGIGDHYTQFGLMNGSVVVELLKDLKREGWGSQARDLEQRMKARADHWNTLPYPFGSEMPWDSTGQEEVYAWTRYFSMNDKSEVSLSAILAYTPAVPHWAYNGSARRYWDFIYGGSKITRVERMLHHYGSSLNALPVLSEFRQNPDDVYLLRIAYAGMIGPLTNIDQQGFPSMAFHAFPDMLKIDDRTGDVGLAIAGHTRGTASYLIDHPEFGWQVFGGKVVKVNNGKSITLLPRDSFRKRVYLAPWGIWLTLDVGQFNSITIDTSSDEIQLTLSDATGFSPAARLRIEQPAAVSGVGSYRVMGSYATERGATVIPLNNGLGSVILRDQ